MGRKPAYQEACNGEDCTAEKWVVVNPGADPGLLKGGGGGVHYRSTSKKKRKGGGGCPGAGPILGAILKSLQRGPKRGSGPPGHPPWIRPCAFKLFQQFFHGGPDGKLEPSGFGLRKCHIYIGLLYTSFKNIFSKGHHYSGRGTIIGAGEYPLYPPAAPV